MTSLRHNPAPADPVLDAARAEILAVGWRRTTLSDVARRAGVSRMTIYRRFADMTALTAELMTREWSRLVPAPDPDLPAPARIAALCRTTVAALRADALFAKIVEVDPELLVPYLLQRRGRTQDALLSGLEQVVADGQREGTLRAGDPRLLARSVLLAAHGFALSTATMTGDGLDAEALDDELERLVERHLAS